MIAFRRFACFVCLLFLSSSASPTVVRADEPEPLRVLFLGNSFTRRNQLATVIERMANDLQPRPRLVATALTYGGRNMGDHWRLRSQDWVRLAELTDDELSRSIAELRAAQGERPDDTYTPTSITNHERLRSALSQPRPKWDYVVLQSWRDTAGDLESAYAEYARRFANLARESGTKVILYDTAPDFQNARPLATSPDRAAAERRARVLAELAAELDALAVPMPLVAWHCQSANPSVTLRYINDGHPNQTMAYLTAATFYSAIFERSPLGLSVDEVTDDKTSDRDKPGLDPDGGPQRKVFDDEQRRFLQSTVEQAMADYASIAEEVAKHAVSGNQ